MKFSSFLLGEFAEVCRGSLQTTSGGCVQVAVKRLKHSATSLDQINFLKEAWTIGQFQHPNVVQLYGVVTKSKRGVKFTDRA